MTESGQNLSSVAEKKSAFTVKALILCGIFTALIAVGAFIRVPLPIIPFTLQFPLVALCGILLGGRNALFSTLAYLLIGLVGFPIFTKGGGIGYIFEPTFGFLVGFVVAAFVIGKFLEKTGKYTVLNIFIACIIGILVDYAFGVLHMYIIMNYYIKTPMGFFTALWSGALVFFPKDLILCLASAFLGSKLLPALKKAKLM